MWKTITVAILGRITLSALRAITSIPHLKMNFPTEFGVSEVIGDQDISKKCYLQTLQAASVGVSKQKQTMRIELEPFIDRRDRRNRDVPQQS